MRGQQSCVSRQFSLIMKGYVDTAWTIWSFGTSIYDYVQDGKVEKQISTLNDIIRSMENVINDRNDLADTLKSQVGTQGSSIKSLLSLLHEQLDHTQAMKEHMQGLLHSVHTQEKVIFSQQCVILLLVAVLVILGTLLYLHMRKRN